MSRELRRLRLSSMLALAKRVGLRQVIDEHPFVPIDRGAKTELRIASLVAGTSTTWAAASSLLRYNPTGAGSSTPTKRLL